MAAWRPRRASAHARVRPCTPDRGQQGTVVRGRGSGVSPRPVQSSWSHCSPPTEPVSSSPAPQRSGQSNNSTAAYCPPRPAWTCRPGSWACSQSQATTGLGSIGAGPGCLRFEPKAEPSEVLLHVPVPVTLRLSPLRTTSGSSFAMRTAAFAHGPREPPPRLPRPTSTSSCTSRPSSSPSLAQPRPRSAGS